MNQSFLIFALARSGSTSLSSALGSTIPLVQEPFNIKSGDVEENPGFRQMLEERGFLGLENTATKESDFAWNPLNRVAEDKRECRLFLDQMLAHFTGIKHVWTTVSLEGNLNILDECLEREVKLIYLSRRNLARAVISRRLAAQAQIFQLGASMEHRAHWRKATFEKIDREEFLRERDQIRELDQTLRAHLEHKPHLSLYYEDLYGSPKAQRAAVSQLCQFVPIDGSILSAEAISNFLGRKDRKQTDKTTLKRIPNYWQLRWYL